MAVQGGETSAGFWDIDEPLPSLRRRVERALAVAAVWIVSALPAALGAQRCVIATLWHVPCPGCGMTRALRLLADGQVGASFRMHALAVPVLFGGALLMVSTVWTTVTLGSPMRMHRSRLGRVAMAVAAVVYGAALAVWALRWFGCFGGPVPVG
jgi:hypothetical protein